MAINATFQPNGQTVLVDNTPRQVPGTQDGLATTYRIFNLAGVKQSITWGSSSSVTSQGPPSAGSPVTNTVSLLANSVETIGGLPADSWFVASSATGFEVTPGEGM